jgi:uncharacterized protein
VKLPDVNVLLAAVNSSSGEHEAARSWLESAFDAPAGVGLAWVALLGFVRIATRHGILPRPLSVEQALMSVRDWIEAPRTRILNPTERHGPLFASLLLGVGSGGNRTTDAHLAALAIEHGATLTSFDSDFERFAGLDFERLRA